ncbi:hypothetical protein [Anaeromyxobacter sp. Fw109-5]|uniref:hypothetical protein n=1 Tax=Anaeromyxobacter sp. (strain Fw109-5) TaxID=404589 RepID=UPI0000ED6FDE|nr:hypothetical protein [Anaeromyxobacter sp. Fw109-5]ABS27860.1 hypothetical protein Anae109_3680 [Anaeromyxobacter sp. Fw109-5]
MTRHLFELLHALRDRREERDEVERLLVVARLRDDGKRVELVDAAQVLHERWIHHRLVFREHELVSRLRACTLEGDGDENERRPQRFLG